MKQLLFLAFILFISSAAHAKDLSFSLLTGIHAGYTDHDTAPAESGAGFEIGPMLYMNLSEKIALRTALTYKKQEITIGDSESLFLFSLDDYARIDFGQILLSVGAQYHFTRKIAIFGDLSYSFNTFGKDCVEVGSNFYNFDCSELSADLKDNFVFFKSGVSMRFIKWLRIEPFLNVSLNNAGKNRLKRSTQVGVNLVLSL